jgi:pilus assembly protein CpaF
MGQPGRQRQSAKAKVSVVQEALIMLNGNITSPSDTKVKLLPVATVEHGESPIGATDNSLSTITQDILRQRAREQAKKPIKRQVREMLSTRLKASSLSLRELDDASEATRAEVLKLAEEVVGTLVQRGLNSKGRLIKEDEAQLLVRYLLAVQFGAGEFEPLFHEPDVEDIVINTVATGRRSSRIEVYTFRQSGKRAERIDASPEDVIEMVNRASRMQGRQLSPVTPVLNAQMLNGARLNAVMNPACDPFLSVTIRIHRLIARTLMDLVKMGTLTEAAAAWLHLCVRAQLAICVGGGTSSGKTNLLNALVRVIESHERIVCIEDTRELDLAVPDKVYLTTVSSQDGARVITQRQLIANALRMRPDRIILGEVRDGAAFDALKACNTGHDGSLLTVHADDADSVPARLMELANEAPETATIPENTLKRMVARAFQMIVFIERRRQPDGSYRRFVTQINELNGHVQSDQITQQKLFETQNGQLAWTRAQPHERTKRRFYEAGFTDKDILDALNGRSRPWE